MTAALAGVPPLNHVWMAKQIHNKHADCADAVLWFPALIAAFVSIEPVDARPVQDGDANVPVARVVVVNVGVVGDRFDELECRRLKRVFRTKRESGFKARAFEPADVIVCIIRQTKSARKETQTPLRQVALIDRKRFEAVTPENDGRVVVGVCRSFPSAYFFPFSHEPAGF